MEISGAGVIFFGENVALNDFAVTIISNVISPAGGIFFLAALEIPELWLSVDDVDGVYPSPCEVDNGVTYWLDSHNSLQLSAQVPFACLPRLTLSVINHIVPCKVANLSVLIPKKFWKIWTARMTFLLICPLTAFLTGLPRRLVTHVGGAFACHLYGICPHCTRGDGPDHPPHHWLPLPGGHRASPTARLDRSVNIWIERLRNISVIFCSSMQKSPITQHIRVRVRVGVSQSPPLFIEWRIFSKKISLPTLTFAEDLHYTHPTPTRTCNRTCTNTPPTPTFYFLPSHSP